MKRSAAFSCIGLALAVIVLAACSGSQAQPAATLPSVTPTASAPTPAPGPDFEALAHAAERDSSSSLPGVYYPLHPGPDGIPDSGDEFVHAPAGFVIPFCTPEQLAANQLSNPVCYHSNPPTSGPHGPAPAPWGVLTSPAPKESLVHNMEHGGVVVWVNTTNQDVLRQLTQITTTAAGSRRLVVMSTYSEMAPETIALTGWTRLDKFPVSEFSASRVTDFIAVHERRFNPEGF